MKERKKIINTKFHKITIKIDNEKIKGIIDKKIIKFENITVIIEKKLS